MWRLRNAGWHSARSPIAAVLLGLIFFPLVPVQLVAAQSIASLFFAHPIPVPPSLPGSPAKEKNTPQPRTVRWSEQQPGSTFSRGDDGKYRYGLWSGDVGIVLAVDARELQLIRHRIEPIFAVLLEIHYRGADHLNASPEGITLQFMKHFKVVQSSLDPDSYMRKVQADADIRDDEARREIARHPDQKEVREKSLQDYQKSVSEMIEFLGRNSLRPAHLDKSNSDASGWVFFNTKNKWLGGWKAQEELILRVPLDGKTYEFPFKLPPEKGEFLLQKRP